MNNITHVAAPAAAVDEPKMTAAEYRAHFGEDETGWTTTTFRGSIEVENIRGEISTYARTVSFTVTHFVDPQYNTVRWNVEHPDRHCDAMFTPDSATGKPGTSIEGVLSTLRSYLHEQEGRQRMSRGW